MKNVNVDKIAIITSGFLPVPATKGGAVENLIVNMIAENEIQKKEKFVIFSIFDEKAVIEAQKYQYTEFIFLKTTKLIKLIDKVTYFFAKKILKKQNSQSYRYIFQRLYFLNCISKDIQKNDYKKIILENHPTQYLCLKWRKNYKKYKGRYFYHCHNEFPSTYGCLDVIKGTNKIICVSKYIKNVLSEYLGMDKNSFIVLRNGIDTQKFKSYSTEELKTMKEKYNIKDEKIILYTGRIVKEKGVYELVSAIKKLKFENYKLIIVGSSLNALKNKSDYEKLIENEIKDIQSKVVFTGYIDYDNIPIFYNIADIVVVPSIWNDPAPLTIIESIVCGTPVITTNSGGIVEYITEDAAKIVSKDKKLIENIAISIDTIINDDIKLKEMKNATKQLAKELDSKTYYDNFIKMIL